MTLASALRSGASAGVNGFGFGGILSSLFWIVISGLGVRLVSRHRTPWLRRNQRGHSQKRYARGAISKEQFVEMRRNVVE